MSDYTKGRLELLYPYIFAEDRSTSVASIASQADENSRTLAKANAHRLVACWNAFDGISEPEKYIERARKLNRDVPQLLAHDAMLTQDRAELIEALQTLLDAVEGNRVTVGDCNQARNALSKHSKEPV